jgi:hypothetical protein
MKDGDRMITRTPRLRERTIMMEFKEELRQLIDKHITPSSTLDDYSVVSLDLTAEADRLDKEAEKFPDEEFERRPDERVCERIRSGGW